VSAITLGRARGVQITALELAVSLVFAKSHSPALGEGLQCGCVKRATAGGTLQICALAREVGISTQIFPGEAGSVERP
jgi:hypothetical protein